MYDSNMVALTAMGAEELMMQTAQKYGLYPVQLLAQLASIMVSLSWRIDNGTFAQVCKIIF